MIFANDFTQRRYPRLSHTAPIKVTVVTTSREFLAKMRDFSEGGLFLICTPDADIQLDSLLTVQTTEIDDALVQTVKVMRIEDNVGYGVQFLLDESDTEFA